MALAMSESPIEPKNQGPLLSVSAVIPVYNSEGTLEELVRRLSAVLSESSREYEILMVNDGSRDGSWKEIERLAQSVPHVRGIDLMRNYGQHNALLCGIREARHEIIATLDDDLQHPPEAIPLMLAKLSEGWDVVYGTPQKERHGLLRDIASQITKLALQPSMGAATARLVSAFRVFRTPVREAFIHNRSSFVSIDVLLTWGTTRFASVPVSHEPRRMGQSQYTFRQLLTHALNMMTGFSALPLQIASAVGFLFALFGLFVLVYVVGRYLIQGAAAPGFAFLASTIAIFSGVQLLSLGIIGEYLARIYFRILEKPPYVVRTNRE